MKTAALFTIVASAAAASAQVTQLPNGTFQCAVANAAFCADSSLGGPIIIRCDANKVGQPGNCGDNLAGEPPLGVGGALCFQTSPTSGDATCEKNCVVYASSGPSSLPSSVCKPSFTASSSSSKPTSTTSAASSSKPTTTTASANSTSSTSTYVKTTITTVVTKSSSVTAPATLSTGTGSGSTTTVGTNGTLSNGGGNGGNGGNGGSGSGSATNTPVGPTSTKGITTVPTAGAATNGISVLALAGLVAAYML